MIGCIPGTGPGVLLSTACRLPAARMRPRKRRATADADADDSDRKYDLCEEDRERVARTAGSLGPPTDRQRDILARLLRTRR